MARCIVDGRRVGRGRTRLPLAQLPGRTGCGLGLLTDIRFGSTMLDQVRSALKSQSTFAEAQPAKLAELGHEQGVRQPSPICVSPEAIFYRA
ncbi:hypothetical protein ABBQ32_003658 [Trebouxia sp. C0010 RCD-2024]